MSDALPAAHDPVHGEGISKHPVERRNVTLLQEIPKSCAGDILSVLRKHRANDTFDSRHLAKGPKQENIPFPVSSEPEILPDHDHARVTCIQADFLKKGRGGHLLLLICKRQTDKGGNAAGLCKNRTLLRGQKFRSTGDRHGKHGHGKPCFLHRGKQLPVTFMKTVEFADGKTHRPFQSHALFVFTTVQDLFSVRFRFFSLSTSWYICSGT